MWHSPLNVSTTALIPHSTLVRLNDNNKLIIIISFLISSSASCQYAYHPVTCEQFTQSRCCLHDGVNIAHRTPHGHQLFHSWVQQSLKLFLLNSHGHSHSVLLLYRMHCSRTGTAVGKLTTWHCHVKHQHQRSELLKCKTVIITNKHILSCSVWGLIEHGLTSAPTQYRLYGRRFLQVKVKRPNQQYQSTVWASNPPT